MKSTYPMTEARARLPKNKRMEATIETMELLANHDFMDIVRKYRAGTLEMKPLSVLR